MRPSDLLAISLILGTLAVLLSCALAQPPRKGMCAELCSSIAVDSPELDRCLMRCVRNRP